jgi:hypothetical protein
MVHASIFVTSFGREIVRAPDPSESRRIEALAHSRGQPALKALASTRSWVLSTEKNNCFLEDVAPLET